MSQNITIKREGMMLDLLLWQIYGVDGQSMLEATLMLNPGLAEAGPFIPLGTVVSIPDQSLREPVTLRPVVSLFG